jgi:hypothetical protein
VTESAIKGQCPSGAMGNYLQKVMMIVILTLVSYRHQKVCIEVACVANRTNLLSLLLADDNYLQMLGAA